jgi:hypothetical protein
MSLRDAVFAGGIPRLSLFRTNLPLPGHSALKLASNFLAAALLQRIGTSTRDKRECENDREGFHLHILGNARINANCELSER